METKMKKIAVTLLLIAGFTQAAIISSVAVSTDDSTKMVTVTYTLADSGAFGATVSMSASSNGGETWGVPVATTYGDIGADVMSGGGKRIFWDAGKDWPDNVSSNMQVRLLAVDQSTNSAAMFTHHPNCRIPVTGSKTPSLYIDDSDGKLQLGRPFDFTDNGDGTVTDNNTGLMWVKDLTGSACNSGVPMPWGAAENWVKTLTFAGYSDWRIADYYEIIMVADLGKDPLSCMPDWLTHTQRKSYWTTGFDQGLIPAGEFSAGDQYASKIDFLFGGLYNSYGMEIQVRDAVKGYSSVVNNFMLVRGTDLTSPQYDGSSQLWKDTNNHLQWGIVLSEKHKEVGCAYDNDIQNYYNTSFDTAKEANAGVWKGHSDWRLPNIKELMTLAQMVRKTNLFDQSPVNASSPLQGYRSSTVITQRKTPCFGGDDECWNFWGVGVDHVRSLPVEVRRFRLDGSKQILVRTYD